MFSLLVLLDDRRIWIHFFDLWIRMRIREAQKNMDPTDPDPQHWSECSGVLVNAFMIQVPVHGRIPVSDR
jgi:hypothetical protein